MYTYECETCGVTVEIEPMEAEMGDSISREAYEFNQCLSCFEKDIEPKGIGGRVNTNKKKRNHISSYYQQALEAYETALYEWQAYNSKIVEDHMDTVGIEAFIRMTTLMGKMRSEKKLNKLWNLHYEISWEYIHMKEYDNHSISRRTI